MFGAYYNFHSLKWLHYISTEQDTAVSVPEKKEVNENSDDLFDEDSDEKDEVDAVKPGRKILPGAVPMFGGVDIFAGQKPGKATKAKPQGTVIFYCRLQVTFHKHVQKYVTFVRLNIFNCSNFEVCLTLVLKQSSEVKKSSSKTRNLFTANIFELYLVY